MRVILLSSHTPSFFWYRVDLMLEMRAHGAEVFAAGQMPEEDWNTKFEELGVVYRQIEVSRNGLNPFKDFETLKSIRNLLMEIKPDKVFLFQAKTVSYGSMAAASLGIKEIYTLIAGVGSVFLGKTLKEKMVMYTMSYLYKQAFRRSKKVFLQNNDDKNLLINKGLLKDDKIVMIQGSGVNLDNFSLTVLPEKPTFLYIGRLVKDKGVGEYLKACQIIKSEYNKKVRCLLVGPYDTNPTALKPNELQTFINDGVIEYFGEQTDVRPFIRQCSVFVLPSYREGTPKTVLEAMSMGRAIITSNAPGCKETVIHGVNGYLTEVKNTKDVAEKMKELIEHPNLVTTMGLKSREMAVDKFDVRKVNHIILETMGIIKEEKD